MTTTRRDILKIGGLGAMGVVGSAALPWGATLGARSPARLAPSRLPVPLTTPFARPRVLRPYRSARDQDGTWVDFFAVTERAARGHVVRGAATPVFGYNGTVPGPTIHVRRGRRAVVRIRNHLPAVHPTFGHDFLTSTHLHGSASLPQYDGYANDLTPPGFYKTYVYPNTQRARTLWYHDHAVHHTAENVYSGLYGQYLIHDAQELRMLPQGEFDVPLSVTDATFAADGSLAFRPDESGLWGDVVLVNGRAWPVMKVRRRLYRFRILVVTVSRSFRFQLADGDPVTIVATDGGLMPRTQTVTQWRQGGAERYEVLVDFRAYRPGRRVVLHNLSNENNRNFAHTDTVMAFDVTDAAVDRRDPTWNRIPERFAAAPSMRLPESAATRSRRFALDRSSDVWSIGDLTWEGVVRSNFQQLLADPDLGDAEVWEFANESGGWFHPMHVHMVDFRIVSRNGRPPFPYEQGPKDVAYVGEDESVRLLMRFEPHRGRYMVHCHNLVHEDHAMMSQFAVGWKPGQVDVNDPILAAPAQVDLLPPDPPAAP